MATTITRAPQPKPRALQVLLEPYLYVSPTLLLLGLTLFVPVLIGIYYSFIHFVVYEPLNRGFAGFENYIKAFNDPIFWLSLRNTVVWTFSSLAFQLLFGLGLALLLVTPFPGQKLYQALVFLPWAVPAFLSGLTWSWLFNPVIGPLAHWAAALGLLSNADNILADPSIALIGPIIANIWFGIPFFAITLLATLTAIPREMYEAAEMDGASSWQQFRFITLPYIAPTIVITALLRTVWIANFSDLIWVMTGGGPADATQITSSYIFTVAYNKLDYGYAAAISVILLMLLILYAVIMLRLRSRLEVTT
jgi:multiple sugar transport system permease protein